MSAVRKAVGGFVLLVVGCSVGCASTEEPSTPSDSEGELGQVSQAMIPRDPSLGCPMTAPHMCCSLVYSCPRWATSKDDCLIAGERCFCAIVPSTC
jgi:hypothetical protein